MDPPLLVAATQVELDAAARRLGPGVRAEALGIGPERAARRMAEILAGFRPRAVIEVGLAGGLDPALLLGDVLVVRSVRAGSESGRPLDPALAARATGRIAAAGLEVQLADVYESPRVVATAADKLALHLATGARAVDMESAAIARAAGSIPHLAVRVVFDTAGEDVALTDDLVDGEGRVRPRALARKLLARPRTTVALVRTGIRARAALDVLARATEAVWGGI